MEVDLSFSLSLSLYAIDTLRSSLACTPAVIHTHIYIYIYIRVGSSQNSDSWR